MHAMTFGTQRHMSLLTSGVAHQACWANLPSLVVDSQMSCLGTALSETAL